MGVSYLPITSTVGWLEKSLAASRAACLTTAVALGWGGGEMRITEEELSALPRRELQARAKAAGVPANLSTKSLVERLAALGEGQVRDGAQRTRNAPGRV